MDLFNQDGRELKHENQNNAGITSAIDWPSDLQFITLQLVYSYHPINHATTLFLTSRPILQLEPTQGSGRCRLVSRLVNLLNLSP